MAWSSQSVPGKFPVGRRKMRQREGRDISPHGGRRQGGWTSHQTLKMACKSPILRHIGVLVCWGGDLDFDEISTLLGIWCSL